MNTGRVLAFALVVAPIWVYILLGACGFWE
jgi:hypothetical protein